MATTSEVPITHNAWTLVVDGSGGAVSGVMTNESGLKIKIQESTSLPTADSTVGHTLKDEPWTYSVNLTNIYAKVFGVELTAAITKSE